MTPKSYQEQHINCCKTCKHNVDVKGVAYQICGFGESLSKNSFYELVEEDGADFNQVFKDFYRSRWVSAYHICDEYEKQEAIA